VTGGVFLILLFSFFIVYTVRRSNYKKFQKQLDEVYLGGNLAKMEYDFAGYDEETEKILARLNTDTEKQVTIDDVLSDNKASVPEEVFAKIDSEGLEEITGKYKPE
ncbi:MAG: hypothetical protein K2K28_02660, partial [Clostridia bacterium]|nr:hypothetical protein [Clostridia bacterium]